MLLCAVTAAILLTALLSALAIFQLALIAGAPLGHFAWGGADRILPPGKRRGSVLAIVIYAVIAWVMLMKADALPAVLPMGVVTVAAWVFTVYFASGIVLNAISRRREERFAMTPVAALLTVLSFMIALG